MYRIRILNKTVQVSKARCGAPKMTGQPLDETYVIPRSGKEGGGHRIDDINITNSLREETAVVAQFPSEPTCSLSCAPVNRIAPTRLLPTNCCALTGGLRRAPTSFTLSRLISVEAVHNCFEGLGVNDLRGCS